MKIHETCFSHPVRGDTIRVAVFEQPDGFLLTEARDGSATVHATLGLFASRDEALARAESRGGELQRQKYTQLLFAP